MAQHLLSDEEWDEYKRLQREQRDSLEKSKAYCSLYETNQVLWHELRLRMYPQEYQQLRKNYQ